MSFSSVDLESYIASHNLQPETADYLRGASKGLSRNVGTSGYASIKTEYQSPKMGTVVNTESRTGELAFALHLDHDADVIGYYEQPPAVDCHRVLKSGKGRLTTYRPDFLVLHKEGPCVIQIKPKNKLDELAERSSDWILEGETYRDLAAERGLSSIGLPHKVVCISQLSKLRTANIALLLQSLDEPFPDETLTRSSLSHLRDVRVTSLASLSNALGLVDLTPLLAFP
jgi:putative transposase